MPTPYAPGGGQRRCAAPAHSRRRNASGICIRMPAPSPVCGSQPQAPRCVRLRSTVEALLDDVVRRLALDVGDEADAAGVVLEARVVQPPCGSAIGRVMMPPLTRVAGARSVRRRAAPACRATRAAARSAWSASWMRSVCVDSTTIVSVRVTPSIERIRLISSSSDDVFAVFTLSSSV